MAVTNTEVANRRTSLAKAAAKRWRARTKNRAAHARQKDATGEADTTERVLDFAIREARRPDAKAKLRRAVADARDLPTVVEKVEFIERMVGPTLDWTETPSGPEARAAARPVARLCSSPDALQQAGFATGFMISGDILLTNHHVFASFEDAEGCYAHFGYESLEDGRGVQRGTFFALRPERFFFSHKGLDFACIAVSPTPLEPGPELETFGSHPIIAATSKILLGHPINIIQHPNGEPRRYAERQNTLEDVLDDHIHYLTDTARGSSGSPCFNRAWEVVGLHHTAVPRTSDGNAILKVDGTRWKEGESEDQIAWVANEGVRISRIVAEMESVLADIDDPSQRVLLEAVLEQPASPRAAHQQREIRLDDDDPELPEVIYPGPRVDFASTDVPRATVHSPLLARPSDDVIIHINAPKTVTIDGHGGIHIHNHSFPQRSTGATRDPAIGEFTEARIRFDEDYSNRKGYDQHFLGTLIKLPDVRASRRAEMVKDTDGRVLVLPYHHFSVAMNARRRLQMWSAVNVDYSPAMRVYSQDRKAFGSDVWREDPRLPARLQLLDEEFYHPATNVDRGHVVRRDDNAWGATRVETEYANSDTFHWTNCSPQHERFNQSRIRGLWGGLEDAIKAFAVGQLDRVVIFAGPVLASDDPDAYGVQYPLRFWKVVAVQIDQRLEAYGFVLDQAPVVDRFGLEERLDWGALRVYQRSIDQIEDMAGVVLDTVVREADVLEQGAFNEVRSGTPLRRDRPGGTGAASRALLTVSPAILLPPPPGEGGTKSRRRRRARPPSSHNGKGGHPSKGR